MQISNYNIENENFSNYTKVLSKRKYFSIIVIRKYLQIKYTPTYYLHA